MSEDKKEKDEVQTSVYPNREVYRQAKAKMALEDESLTSLVNKWLKEYVEGEKEGLNENSKEKVNN